MFTRDELDAARALVRASVPATPQQRWPLLDARLAAQVWVKHENHTPVGAFKLRGGLVYFDALCRREPGLRAVFSATRGNHGQSVAFAAARQASGARSRIVGVVSAHAPAYLRSFEAGHAVEAPVTTVLADGMACRVPEPAALAIIRREVDSIVAVTDDEVAAAMRALFSDTHNVAEGAGAAALAAALQQRERLAGRSIGLALTGGNVDSAVFAQVLAAG